MTCYVRGISAKAPNGAWGIVTDDTVTLLDGSPMAGGKATDTRIALSDISTYLPPVDATNVLCIGANYAEHCNESDVSIPDHPLLFIKPTTAIMGHGQPIVLPAEAPDEVDYEAELVVIIGKTAKNVREEDALDYVFGYTCGNDISARDCQLRIDRQWARGKSFDTFAPVGPFLETDFDASDVSISFKRNGETLQDSRTKYMIFNIPFLISYLSRQMTLLPGTVLFTGTPDGVGMGRQPQVWLREKDVCDVTIDGLGTLSNPVVRE